LRCKKNAKAWQNIMHMG
jgi:hypothetical protein